MPLAYMTGEEIRKCDRVLFHGEPGEIELVIDPMAPDPDSDWYARKYGRGVMILEPKHFGRVFLPEPHMAEDLESVARQD
jgi:hypothetical protein